MWDRFSDWLDDICWNPGIYLVIIGLVMAGSCGFGALLARGDDKPGQPLTLFLHPHTGFMPLDGRPFRVQATALLLDPKHKSPCPGWVIWWGDGEKSTQAPTVCRLPERPADRQTWTVVHHYKQPFEGKVEVATMDMLTDGAKPMRATSRLVLR